MPTSPIYGFRYPIGQDPANVPLDIQHLALDVDSVLSTLQAARDAQIARVVGIEARTNGTQTVAASSATKLTFGSTPVAPSNVTWSGNNTLTFLEDGAYSLYVSAATGFSSSGNWGVGVHYSSGPPGPSTAWLSPPTFSQGQTDSSTANPERRFHAGDQICAYFYNNEAATRVVGSAKPAEFIVYKIHD